MRLLKMAALALAATLTIGATAKTSDTPADWNSAIAVTPSGSHLLGNPDAPVRVAEYISYTCPHCAHFHRESEGALRIGYIRSGKVSVEVRNLVRDAADLTAAMLANCGDTKFYYRKHNAFLMQQDQWEPRMLNATPAQKQRWTTGPLPQRLRALASDLKFYGIMEQAGYDTAATDRCLADEAMAKRLVAQTQEAVNAGVTGTPSFMINGALLEDTYDWESLQKAIEARLQATT